MSEDNEKFLSRWARLKQQTREQPAAVAADAASARPELPPLDALDFNSDLKDFFHRKVDEKLRRAALKTLLRDPHFNVMDGLDVYIDDYSKFEPIPPEMLQQLVQLQNMLAGIKQDEAEHKTAQPAPLAEVQAAPAVALAEHTEAAALTQPPTAQSENVEPIESVSKS